MEPNREFTARPASGHQPLLFAPEELLRCGLSAAHPRPLVGCRRDDGDIRSWRTSPARAWLQPLVEWGRAGSSYAALVLDCDSRDSIERTHAAAMGAGPVPTPNLTMTRSASGHVHAAWILGTPVHRGASARERPLKLFGRVAEYFTTAVGADTGYAGVLAGNPTHADYLTAYPRAEPYELRELARVVPDRWRIPTPAVSEPGRNCMLFRECCRWGLRITDDELMFWALARNRGMRHPLDRAEVEGMVESVCRYRARWRAQGHKEAWLKRQSTRGRIGGRPRIYATNAARQHAYRDRVTKANTGKGLFGLFGVSAEGCSSSSSSRTHIDPQAALRVSCRVIAAGPPIIEHWLEGRWAAAA